MGPMRTAIISLLLASPAWAAQDLALKVDLKAEQVAGSLNLGSLQVTGVGTVKLSARRQGEQLMIQALGPEKQVLGSAESVVGLYETPIYVTTPQGLKKLTVLWKRP